MKLSIKTISYVDRSQTCIKGSLLIVILLLLERLELALATDAGHDEVAVLVLSDEASADELREQIEGCLSFAFAVLHHLHLGLEDNILRELCLGLLRLALLSFKLVGDLLLGPSSLGACLEQLGRDALFRYEKKTSQSTTRNF